MSQYNYTISQIYVRLSECSHFGLKTRKLSKIKQEFHLDHLRKDKLTFKRMNVAEKSPLLCHSKTINLLVASLHTNTPCR